MPGFVQECTISFVGSQCVISQSRIHDMRVYKMTKIDEFAFYSDFDIALLELLCGQSAVIWLGDGVVMKKSSLKLR